jgi:hypothetical protein
VSITCVDAISETDGVPETEWAELPAGPELGFRLALVEWDALSDRELVAVMEAARRQTSWSQGWLLTAVGELSRRRYDSESRCGSDAHRRVAGEVSVELTVTHGQAEELLWLAEDLPERLPATWQALRTGQLDYDRAKVMVEGLSGLSGELARRLDEELVGDAVGCTRSVLRRRLTRAVRAADPGAFAERAKQARDERRLELWDNPDSGTCDLVGRNLTAADAHAIVNRLTAAATAMRTDGDTRPIDQIRLDLFCGLLRGITLPDAVHHLIAGDADGVEQASGRDGAGTDHGPCGPEGNPAQDAQTPGDVLAAVEALIARVLADTADEHLTRLVDRAHADGRTDGMSLLIGHAAHAMRDGLAGLVDSWCRTTGTSPGAHGHHGYRPPAAMQRLVQHRHGTCAFPTCTRRATRCDLDHTTPHHKGGHTCRCNLAPLCRTHHRVIKQHPTWTLVQPWPGLLIWVTPAGTWHIVTPQ